MTTLSLREAAEQTGVSKSTIFRAIKSGRMSAAKDDDGNFLIDPAELFRVYPPKSSKDDVARDVLAQGETRPMGRYTTAVSTTDATELRIRNAELEAQIKGLQTIVEMEKQRAEDARQRAEELKAERDRWASALEASQRQITHLTEKQAEPKAEKRSSWWPFRKSA
jgi:excisionase family DNA binding protein